MARNPKLTPEVQAKILGFIAKSVPYKFAAEGSGISEKTIYDWINRGKQDIEEDNDSSIYAQFLQELYRVESENVGELLYEIRADKSWQAKAWTLERRWKREFGKDSQDLEALQVQMEELKRMMLESRIPRSV